jgi:hypothetical protein
LTNAPADAILRSMATENPNPAGPYRVERVETSDGPRWRLTGPGQGGTKAYPWDEFREKLGEMADLMNFAWRQAKAADGGADRS